MRGTDTSSTIPRELNGTPIGHVHTNPLLDTREYEMEFKNGTMDRYHANTIAEKMYAHVDNEGKQVLLVQDKVDHGKDDSAIAIDDGFTISQNGNRVPKKTTQGWKLAIQWQDG